MTELFVSYSHRDRAPVARMVGALEKNGYQVWWDRRLRPYQAFGQEIEAALKASGCAVVAWSSRARDSLWVRAEATEAWESGKLLQVSLDGSDPPLPFTMIHLLNFAGWSGRVGDPPWELFEEAIQAVVRGDTQEPMRVDPATASAGEPPSRLSGFGSAAAVGAASLSLIIVAAGIVGVGAAGLFSAERFGLLTSGMFLAALVAFGHMLTRVIKISLASG